MPILSDLSENGRALTIKIIGKFQFPMASEFRRAYTNVDQVEEYSLDLQESEYLDSSALGMIIALWEYVERDKNRIKVINASEEVKNILKSANFDQLVSMI
ncbi:MAG: STAS domain-containing protein [gamma proteobacterium symbiont of Bathyaustriella thionipta]|nr:STAS domain-containing protein [gamma proteobacterium symbiont of Bathyaustriella thionipta]MCU7950934.1 STAS domain-containing protein [gamma proteobacterium symbiont of Bathyaustriella thionipta]MCU7952745.1 STAS domain-containing protein [gamma proteobacterium symbiont of Bathyaustriella thionipta]MCU7957425.1 STAS domain-containing protein [gamma proteobacterium symbiont of Bathyaustriella thionipta]MCU7968695.1 STAS domain-containing protein [gamma proteobacterium symbiont of Bathyaustr